MIIKDLQQFALLLKSELLKNLTAEEAQRIATKIANAKYENGNCLTDTQKQDIINYIKYPKYNHITKKIGLDFSDNSNFIELVELIAKMLKE